MSKLFNQVKTHYELDDIMPMGKYQGIEIARLVYDDPRYMNWMVENCDTFYVSDIVRNLIDNELQNHPTNTRKTIHPIIHEFHWAGDDFDDIPF